MDNTAKYALGGVAAIVLITVLWYVSTYNYLVGLNQAVDRQWANVEAQYQRRVDLIPNLVNVVKGYASFEERVLKEITEIRSRWQTAPTQDEKIAAAGDVERTISRLLLVAENYPELKASQNFLSLQDELAGTENRISVERMRYNDDVRKYNTAIHSIPTSIIAGQMGLIDRKYFEAEKGAEKAPQVEFP